MGKPYNLRKTLVNNHCRHAVQVQDGGKGMHVGHTNPRRRPKPAEDGRSGRWQFRNQLLHCETQLATRKLKAATTAAPGQQHQTPAATMLADTHLHTQHTSHSPCCCQYARHDTAAAASRPELLLPGWQLQRSHICLLGRQLCSACSHD